VSAAVITAPLHNPIYRRLFVAQVIGLVGTGLATVAMGLLAFEIAGGNAGQVLGVVLALKVGTYVLVSPVVAAWGAGISRKKLLVSMDLIRALAIAAVAFVDQPWQFYVLIVVVSAASAGFTPAFQAIIPDIFEDEETYTEALSIHRLAYEIEAVFSPMLAGLLLTAVSFSALFAFNAAAFLVSASLVVFTAIPVLGHGELGERTIAQINRGIRHFLSVPRLRGLFALDWAVAAAGAMVIINTVVFVKGDWGLGDSEVAWALGSFGAGSMAVALSLPYVFRRIRDRWVMILGGAIQAAALAVTWLFVGSLPGLIACWVLIGTGTSMILTSSGRLIQRSGSSAERPPLFAAQFSLSHLCWLFTYPIAGFAGGLLSLPAAAAILAAVALAGTLAAVFLWPAEPELGQSEDLN
jgi:MFS family permease